MTKKPLTIAIIGQGKVGQSLYQLLSLTEHKTYLIGRSLSDQRSAVKEADVSLLTTPDDDILTLCRQLADSFKPGSVVAHCSGALSSVALSAARQNNCALASLHPLNSFPTLTSSLDTFSHTGHGTYLYAEGDPEALNVTLPVVSELGFKPLKLAQEAKTAYHTACVFACNYLTTLMNISLDTAESADLNRNEFWQAVQPLIQTTLNNISDHGTVKSLSGPLVRGDIETIEQHLSNLGENKTPYKQLGLHTLKIAAQRGELSKEQIAKMEALLS